MPIYEYRCSSCERISEVNMSFGDLEKLEPVCKDCLAIMKRIYTTL
jgi:putative FmdB family regulatory protein